MGRELIVDIRKSFPHGAELDISFRTDLGFTVLFGRSAAGKTVTLSAIAGLLRPDQGTVKLGGTVFFDSDKKVDLKPQERNIGFVFQSYALFPHKTVAENIELALKARPRKAGLSEKEDLIEELGISDVLGRYPSQLSGGQQQRAALARALITGPDLLLLDEPFSALDAPVRDRLRSLIKNVQKRHNVPVLMITHQPFEAYYLAEDLVVIENGRVSQQGVPEEVFYRPMTGSVARLVGMKNIFSGKVQEINGEILKIATGSMLIEAEASNETRSLGLFKSHDEVEWCIRPEDVMILRRDQPVKNAVRENQLEVTVLEVERYGPTWEMLLAAGSDLRIKASVPAHSGKMLELTEGACITISLKRQSIHVIPAAKLAKGASEV